MATILQTGDWAPGEIEAEFVPSGRRIVPEVEELIDCAWREALARPGAHLFDGPMCRLERWEVTGDGHLRLVLSHSSYKPFLGTNMKHPELADWFGDAVLANPVGVSPALETADGFLLLGRRNAAVAYYPERIHPFAGALEPRDGGDVFAAVRRELREELSLGDADILDVRCTGIVREPALRQTEMIFRARTSLSRDRIVARLGREEHRGVYDVRATEAGVEAALAEPLLTPVAVAALLLWGRVNFGRAWFDARSAGPGASAARG
jgi:hypothetical protein